MYAKKSYNEKDLNGCVSIVGLTFSSTYYESCNHFHALHALNTLVMQLPVGFIHPKETVLPNVTAFHKLKKVDLLSSW